MIEKKSFKFAIRIVNLYKHLSVQKKEYILSKQLLRSGTSVGANVSEAVNAQSKKDFLSKMNIALKEATETKYWIKLLHETDYIEDNHYQSILSDCIELEKILSSIVKTTKEKLKVIENGKLKMEKDFS